MTSAQESTIGTTVVVNYDAVRKNSLIKTKLSHDYMVMNYIPGYVCFNDEESGKYRSVVVSQSTQGLVGYGPKKSVAMDTFMKRYPEFEGHLPMDVDVMEMVEGTMINLFFDRARNTWEIATKSAVGGHYWYFRQDTGIYPQYTFRQMFMETVGEAATADLNDSYLVQNLNKKYSYSFVLQHPANHIVLDIPRPKAYLVAIFEIIDDGSTTGKARVRHLPLYQYAESDTVMMDKLNYGICYLPWRYPGQSPRNVTYSSVEIDNGLGRFPVGYMIVHSLTGDRVSVKSEHYERLKQLRGNNPNIQYQFLAIIYTRKIAEFLQYFPMYNKLFRHFHGKMTEYVKNYHKLYVEFYVKKTHRKNLEVTLDKTVRYYLYKLHREKHVNQGRVVTESVVREWFLHEMDPATVLYLLRTPIYTLV